MATENKKLNNPVINVLTQAQYDSITNPSEDEFYLITDDITQVANGGTGLASLTAGSVLVGNGTNPVTLKAIDTTAGGTANSTDLITSGAVYSGLNNKVTHTFTSPLTENASTHAVSLNTVPVDKGGTGAITFTSGEALIGNGANALSTKPIDATTGGTQNSTNLITSGAVYSGLAQKSDGVIIRTWS